MRRPLRAAPAAAKADIRPTLLGVVTLMFLLLFFLLQTSSGQRLGTIDLRLGSPGDLAPLPHAGLVKEVRVALHGPDGTVTFDVQSTDIAAAATTLERRVLEVPGKNGAIDFPALLAALEEVHAIDGSQERARLDPDDATSADTLFAVMDVVRGPPQAPLFPKLTLSGAAE